MSPFDDTGALTFDLFGTVLDLAGSLTPPIARFLEVKSSAVAADQFWADWRDRQRIEQYQDNIVALGHSGYQTVARRACVYTLRLHGIEFGDSDVNSLMAAWQDLRPFPEVVAALERLGTRFRLVALSNGELDYLRHLAANRIGWEFDEIISVEAVGAFKPHPGVYRRAAGILGLEVGDCLMVSANAFDVMGARMCGFRGVYVNRYALPYDDSPFRPDATVADFTELADLLTGQ